MFLYHTTIKIYHTDAAGILFFGHLFMIAYDAFQEFSEGIGLGVGTILRNEEYILPVVHAEADYAAPLYVGDRITVRVRVERLGTSSVTISYSFAGENGNALGSAKTVHVAVSRATHAAIPLPRTLRDVLEKHVSEDTCPGECG